MVAPALSLHFPLIVKEQVVVRRELMAQKDFIEMLFRFMSQTGFFFPPFQIDFFYSPKCQHFKVSFMGAEAVAGVRSVNRAQPCDQHALEASGRVVSLS